MLNDSGEYPLDEEDIEELESKRREIHTRLLATFEEAEKSGADGDQPDPLQTLRSSIAEAKLQIAEKERVSEYGTSAMHPTDLKNHFESLARLRFSLAEMEKKLARAEVEEL